MDDKPTLVPVIDQLRRRRAYRRGAITKLQKIIDTLLEKDLATVNQREVKKFIDDLKREVSLHNSVQDQIETLLADDDAAFEQELNESEKHRDLHATIKAELEFLDESVGVWSVGNVLAVVLTNLLNSEEKTSPTFAVRCDKFTNDVNAFAKQASLYMT